jgi:hypothetical protein
MLEYMKADPTVNHIELDGHSDNSGNRLTNRDLSRRRAWRWPSSSRPMASPNADHVRFHGERYPLAPTQQCQPGARIGSPFAGTRSAARAGGPASHEASHIGDLLTRRSSSRSRHNLSLCRHKLSRHCKLCGKAVESRLSVQPRGVMAWRT